LAKQKLLVFTQDELKILKNSLEKSDLNFNLENKVLLIKLKYLEIK